VRLEEELWVSALFLIVVIRGETKEWSPEKTGVHKKKKLLQSRRNKES
tara:strand:+ start:67 stop:210 length:144 start_codon:yes stop_codon:yes gene_type:complete